MNPEFLTVQVHIHRLRHLGMSLGVSLGIMIFSAQSGVSQERKRSNEEWLEEIHKVLDDRDRRRNPLWLKYELDEVETAEWRQLHQWKSLQDSLATKLRCEIAWKGEKFFSGLCASPSGGACETPDTFTLLDGKASLSKSREDAYQISRSPSIVFHGQPIFSLSGENSLREGLDAWAKRKMPIELIDIKEVNGALLLSFTVKQTKWKYKYTLIREQEYAVAEAETTNEAGQYVTQVKITGNDSFSGVIIPIAGVHKHYARGNVLGVTKTFKVTFCKTAAAEIPDALFQHEIPRTAVVYDTDRKIFIRSTTETQRDWDEIAQLFGPRPTKWLPILVWVLLAGGLVALAVKFRRFFVNSTRKSA